MKFHACIFQSRIDAFEAFKRTQINVVDGRANQHKIFGRRMFRNARVDLIFEKAGIGKIQTFINAH